MSGVDGCGVLWAKPYAVHRLQGHICKGVESYVTCINEILPENNALFWQISTEIVHILVVWRSQDFG